MKNSNKSCNSCKGIMALIPSRNGDEYVCVKCGKIQKIT
jgi:predicted RNA-binding Zn-ribbon protein involved in translation (DUF1610 family)